MPQACAIVQSMIQLVLVLAFGYGKVQSEISAQARYSHRPSKLSFANQILFKLTTPLSKLSLCLLYHTMCSTSTDRVIRITRGAVRSTIALIIGAYGSALFVSIFQCLPVSKVWDKNIDGRCVDLKKFRMRVRSGPVLNRDSY